MKDYFPSTHLFSVHIGTTYNNLVIINLSFITAAIKFRFLGTVNHFIDTT